jgi:hypothetical protein
MPRRRLARTSGRNSRALSIGSGNMGPMRSARYQRKPGRPRLHRNRNMASLSATLFWATLAFRRGAAKSRKARSLGFRLNFFELCSDQPSSPSLGKLLLGLFAGGRPADPRALFRIDQHAGYRPKPAVAGRAACLPHERPDNRFAAKNDQVLVAGLPVGATKLLGGFAKTKGHGPRLRSFGGALEHGSAFLRSGHRAVARPNCDASLEAGVRDPTGQSARRAG